MTFRRNYFPASYLNYHIYYENHTENTVMKRKDKKYSGQCLTPTGHSRRPFRPLWSLYAATAATVEYLVMDARHPALICFPIIAQRS